MNIPSFKTLDRRLSKQPQEIKFCTKCVVSNQRPRITFDKENVCSACRYAEEKHHQIDWTKREQELQELCNHYRSKDGSYDVVVPASGGKDSTYVAYELKHNYGMHPLTVTWSPFIYTDVGWRNFQRFIQAGYDNIMGSPDGVLHRKLAKLCFELVGDAWEPFAYGQMSFGYHIAAKFGIRLIFHGENGEAEYGGLTKNRHQASESLNYKLKHYYKGSGLDEIVKEGLARGVFSKREVQSRIFDLYKPPPLKEVKKLNIRMHWMSYYKKWIPQEHYYLSQKHTGFEANPDGRSEGTYSKYASLDDKLDGFHYYLAFIKFGIGRATSDAAHEIRDGHITREEGVALVRKYDGEFPKKYFKDFLDYLDITEEYFWNVVNFYRSLSPQVWKNTKGKWTLKRQVG